MKKIADVVQRAWAEKNPELLRGILANEFVWYDDAFSQPLTSADDLINSFQHDIADQENIKVNYKVILEKGNKLVGRWQASYDSKNKANKIDGVFVIETDGAGRLTLLRQWWVSE